MAGGWSSITDERGRYPAPGPSSTAGMPRSWPSRCSAWSTGWPCSWLTVPALTGKSGSSGPSAAGRTQWPSPGGQAGRTDLGGMRKAPPGVHRERADDRRPAVWYVVWLGEPHAKGSVILGRSRRLDRHLTHRFFPERRGADSQGHQGLGGGRRLAAGAAPQRARLIRSPGHGQSPARARLPDPAAARGFLLRAHLRPGRPRASSSPSGCPGTSSSRTSTPRSSSARQMTRARTATPCPPTRTGAAASRCPASCPAARLAVV